MKNILGGFRGLGLLPYNPESVLSKLDMKFKTPTPPDTSSGLPDLWTLRTLTNTNEAALQSTLLTDRISRHRGSSPTSIIEGIHYLAKGTTIVMHQMALLEAEVKTLRETNNTLSRRRRVRKQRLRDSGAMSIANGQDLMAQNEANVQINQEMLWRSRRKAGVETKPRRCGTYGNAGHNARTCQVVISSADEDTSD